MITSKAYECAGGRPSSRLYDLRHNVQGMLNFLAARRCVCVFSFCFYAMLAF